MKKRLNTRSSAAASIRIARKIWNKNRKPQKQNTSSSKKEVDG